MQAKRGYLPKDDRYFSHEAQKTLRTASEHVCYLINQGYDLKQATAFVGNHFQLSERQRVAIMRSVATKDQLSRRRNKEIPLSQLDGQDIWVDGLNTIITLEVMLSDSPLFVGMDGAVRDLASLRGTYRLIPITAQAIQTLFDVFRSSGARKVTVLLDKPVSNSGRLKQLLDDMGEAFPFELVTLLQNDVDRALYERENVVSTDSVVLDRCVSWVNVARYCLEQSGREALALW